MANALQRNPRSFFNNSFIVLVVIVLVGFIIYLIATRYYLNDEPPIQSSVMQIEPAPEPAVYSAADLLVIEDFEVDTGAWSISPVGQARYDGGGLILNDDLFEGNAWARPHLGLDNFVLDIHARWLGGSIGGDYGVQFRLDDQSGDYYAFQLENAGRYVINKRLDGDVFEVTSGYSEAIQNNGGVNLIHIEALGETFHFFVNGTYLVTVESGGPPSGDIMLFATKSDGTEQFLAAFDNLRVARYLGSPQVGVTSETDG